MHLGSIRAAQIPAALGFQNDGVDLALLASERIFVAALLPRRKSYSTKPLCAMRVANACGHADHASPRRSLERFVASGPCRNENVRLRGSTRVASAATGRSPCQKVGRYTRPDWKLRVSMAPPGADQAIDPIRLARTPFLVPESQQGLEVPIERLRCGDRYSILARRFDLLQEAADLLPRIGAERVEIGVPVVRQRGIGAETVVDLRRS